MKVIIPTNNSEELYACVASLRLHEPRLPIIAVCDGEVQTPPGVTRVEGIQPFVFARNVNLALKLSFWGQDTVIMNQDARLETDNGFTNLANQLYAIVSPGIDGECGLPSQKWQGRTEAVEHDMLCFICVLIRGFIFDAVGMLDERFIGSGFEDNDYCRRVKNVNQKLAVWDSCKVSHRGWSANRSQPDYQAKFDLNQRLYEEKWK